MKKLATIDFAIMLCLYIAVASFPFNLFIKDNDVLLYLLFAILRLIFFVGVVIYVKKNKVGEDKYKNSKNILFMLPFYLACFTNLAYELFQNSMSFSSFDTLLFLARVFCSLATALAEDIVFRTSLFSILKNKKPLLRILFSALIFGAAHLVNFFASFNPIVFVQVGYTFLIGLVLGLIYEYSGSFICCAIFHFLYNAINSDLFELTYTGNEGISFYINAIIFGGVLAIYGVLIYYFVLRKYNNEVEIKDE